MTPSLSSTRCQRRRRHPHRKLRARPRRPDRLSPDRPSRLAQARVALPKDIRRVVKPIILKRERQQKGNKRDVCGQQLHDGMGLLVLGAESDDAELVSILRTGGKRATRAGSTRNTTTSARQTLTRASDCLRHGNDATTSGMTTSPYAFFASSSCGWKSLPWPSYGY